MRTIDKNAVKAKNDPHYEETFIKDYEVFILQAAHKSSAGKYITKSDDQWSVSLSAFHEAIKSYSYEKGSFLSFAEMVIKRRLCDDYKKQSKHFREVSISPYIFDNNTDEENEDIAVKRQVLSAVVSHQDDDAKLEIDALSSLLNKYGFSFMDLVSTSPKSKKTKKICAKAIAFVCKDISLIKEMKRTKSLPLKVIQSKLFLPRKTLERHRKYIIAGVEILSGDFPVLAEYLKFVREEFSN